LKIKIIQNLWQRQNLVFRMIIKALKTYLIYVLSDGSPTYKIHTYLIKKKKVFLFINLRPIIQFKIIYRQKLLWVPLVREKHHKMNEEEEKESNHILCA